MMLLIQLQMNFKFISRPYFSSYKQIEFEPAGGTECLQIQVFKLRDYPYSNPHVNMQTISFLDARNSIG